MPPLSLARTDQDAVFYSSETAHQWTVQFEVTRCAGGCASLESFLSPHYVDEICGALWGSISVASFHSSDKYDDWCGRTRVRSQREGE